jgi:hypothetical protein
MRQRNNQLTFHKDFVELRSVGRVGRYIQPGLLNPTLLGDRRLNNFFAVALPLVTDSDSAPDLASCRTSR